MPQVNFAPESSYSYTSGVGGLNAFIVRNSVLVPEWECSVSYLGSTKPVADLLGWLRRQKGYQTRINAVLRTWMEAQKP